MPIEQISFLKRFDVLVTLKQISIIVISNTKKKIKTESALLFAQADILLLICCVTSVERKNENKREALFCPTATYWWLPGEMLQYL